jgi:hypothetical protein
VHDNHAIFTFQYFRNHVNESAFYSCLASIPANTVGYGMRNTSFVPKYIRCFGSSILFIVLLSMLFWCCRCWYFSLYKQGQTLRCFTFDKFICIIFCKRVEQNIWDISVHHVPCPPLPRPTLLAHVISTLVHVVFYILIPKICHKLTL